MRGPIASFFLADHERLDGLLRLSVAKPGELDAASFAAFRAGLLKHIAWEEKLLLPALRRAGGEVGAVDARRLRVDHGAIALLLVPSPTPELVAELRSILEPHNRLEEGPEGLYAHCDQVLAEQAEALVARARAYPEVKVAAHYDGKGVCRSAREALAISGKQH